MPYVKQDKNVDCHELYCSLWCDGGCTADEPAEVLSGDEFCQYIMIWSSVNLLARNGSPAMKMSSVPKYFEKGILQSARENGIAINIMDKGADLSVIWLKEPGRRVQAVFRVADTSNMLFYPCVDGSVGWENSNQLDLFDKSGG
jgi:hypothetical protein